MDDGEGEGGRGSDLVLEIDSSGAVVRVGAGANVLGISWRDMATVWDVLPHVHAEDVARLATFAAIATPGDDVAIREQVRIRRSDGDWIRAEVEISSRPGAPFAVRLLQWGLDVVPTPPERSILDNAPVPFGILSEAGMFAVVSRALCGLLGFEEAELVGRAPMSFVHPDDAAIAGRIEQVMAAGATGAEAQLRWLRADGTPVVVLEQRGRSPDDPTSGTAISLVEPAPAPSSAIDRDIAMCVMDTAGVLLVAVDREGRIVLANLAAAATAGEMAKGLTWQRLDEALPSVPGEPSVADLAARAAAGEVIREVELLLPAAAGTERVLSWSASTVEHHEHGPLVVLTALDVTERQAHIVDLTRRALHDPLTHLPNRNLLRERLTHALNRLERKTGEIGVLFIDLDGFKHINDTFGHDAGDRTLVLLAARLQAAVRPGDTVARFGGDEFVVLLEDVEHDEDALEVATRLAETIEAPIAVGDATASLSASIGIAFARHVGADADALLRQADAAMYESKRAARRSG